MIYQVGNKQCSNSGRKRNDIDPQDSDFLVQPPHPPGISSSLRGGGLDIFWNYTICLNSWIFIPLYSAQWNPNFTIWQGNSKLILFKEHCCKGTPDLTIWQHNNVN